MTEMHEWPHPGRWEVLDLPGSLADLEVTGLIAGAIAVEEGHVFLLALWEIDGKTMWQKSVLSDGFGVYNSAEWLKILEKSRFYLIKQMHAEHPSQRTREL